MALRRADLVSASLVGVTLVLVVGITNPNAYDLKIRAVRAQTVIAGKYPLPPIDMAPDLWLPSGQTTEVRIPTTIPWLVLPGILSETLGSETISYQVDGSADVTAVRAIGIEKDSYPMHLTGTLPRQLMVNFGAGSVSF